MLHMVEASIVHVGFPRYHTQDLGAKGEGDDSSSDREKEELYWTRQHLIQTIRQLTRAPLVQRGVDEFLLVLVVQPESGVFVILRREYTTTHQTHTNAYANTHALDKRYQLVLDATQFRLQASALVYRGRASMEEKE